MVEARDDAAGKHQRIKQVTDERDRRILGTGFFPPMLDRGEGVEDRAPDYVGQHEGWQSERQQADDAGRNVGTAEFAGQNVSFRIDYAENAAAAEIWSKLLTEPCDYESAANAQVDEPLAKKRKNFSAARGMLDPNGSERQDQHRRGYVYEVKYRVTLDQRVVGCVSSQENASRMRSLKEESLRPKEAGLIVIVAFREPAQEDGAKADIDYSLNLVKDFGLHQPSVAFSATSLVIGSNLLNKWPQSAYRKSLLGKRTRATQILRRI